MQSSLSLLSESKADSESQASFPFRNYTTRWEPYPEQQVPGCLPAALLLINLFYIAFSTARKLPLIINRNAEATRGNQNQRTAAALIRPQLLSKRTQSLSWADMMLGAVGGTWEGTWEASLVLEWISMKMGFFLLLPFPSNSGKLKMKVARDRTYRAGTPLRTQVARAAEDIRAVKWGRRWRETIIKQGHCLQGWFMTLHKH